MDSVRERIRSLLKLSSGSVVPSATVIDQVDGDGFTRSLIQYSVPDGDRIEAFLFQPTDETLPGAVLALHQHNSQWTIGKSEIAGSVGDPLQAFGPALARRGVTVLAPDAVGFESRLKTAGWGASLAPPLHRPTVQRMAGCSTTTRWPIGLYEATFSSEKFSMTLRLLFRFFNATRGL